MSSKRNPRDPGDLKGIVLDFVHSPRMSRELDQAVRKRFPGRHRGKPVVTGDEAEIANFWDWFALQRPTRDGRTPAEIVADERADLPDDVREQLRRWRDVMEGLFEILEIIDGETARVYEHLRGREMVIHASVENAMRKMAVGHYLITRVVPWFDTYYVSGVSSLVPPEFKPHVPQMVADMRAEHPELAWEAAPEETKQVARQTQAEVYRAFVAFFGADEYQAATGRELMQRMKEFIHYQYFEHVAQDGKTMAQKAQEIGWKIELPPLKFPDDLLETSDVALLANAQQGIHFLVQYGAFKRLFSEGISDLAEARRLIYGYLKDNNVPASVFQRMVELYPQQAQRVFQATLTKRKFNLNKDFPQLMRRYKRDWLEGRQSPFIIPVTETE